MDRGDCLRRQTLLFGGKKKSTDSTEDDYSVLFGMDDRALHCKGATREKRISQNPFSGASVYLQELHSAKTKREVLEPWICFFVAEFETNFRSAMCTFL